MRSTIKRAVMDAYCRGWLPAWCVRFAFKALGLKGA